MMLRTFIIQSHSRNEKLWQYVAESIILNVPNSRVFILTDLAPNVSIDKCTIVQTNGNSWYEVLKIGLEKIVSLGIEGAIFTFDDLFIRSVNSSLLDVCEKQLAGKEVKCLHLAHKHLASNHFYGDLKYCRSGRYEYTLVYTYWDLAYLTEVMSKRKNFSPWEFENFGRYQNEETALVFKNNIFSYSNYLVRGKRAYNHSQDLDRYFDKMSLTHFCIYSMKRCRFL